MTLQSMTLLPMVGLRLILLELLPLPDSVTQQHS